MDPSTCQCIMTNSGRITTYQQCPRKPKERRPASVWFSGAETIEIDVCGMHAGVYDRAKAKHDAYVAKEQAAIDKTRPIVERAEALAKELGIFIEVEQTSDKDFVSSATGFVRVKLDDLERIVKERSERDERESAEGAGAVRLVRRRSVPPVP